MNKEVRSYGGKPHFLRPYPWHLTPFGVWLWWRVPVWTKRNHAYGDGYKRLMSRRGFMWCGISSDWYHGYWIATGITHWRCSLRILGKPVYRWWHRGQKYRLTKHNLHA